MDTKLDIPKTKNMLETARDNVNWYENIEHAVGPLTEMLTFVDDLVDLIEALSDLENSKVEAVMEEHGVRL